MNSHAETDNENFHNLLQNLFFTLLIHIVINLSLLP